MNIISIRWKINCSIKKALYSAIFKYCEFERNVSFRDNFHVYLEKSGHLRVGENTFFNNDCSIIVHKEVTIGKNCLFGENVKIYDHDHIFKYIPKLITSQGFKSEKVSIGDNTWIGSNVIILKGTSIGSNCVIGAGNVVKGNISSCTIMRSDGNCEKIEHQ